ncbi:hypothetical protein CAOG_002275 [Capsaspora owczarzaki ATCC 30864]|uniref:Uncharacterized protein n=1 Tax=Capsaspora owczarzaki (strain ATCC 30864) TaxID=595528 RepID=A0A0D2U7K0_CAPO3|nr:hypothetical protein CAOG_002275 [Capsaspora owczarzaki ATCC 30864]
MDPSMNGANAFAMQHEFQLRYQEQIRQQVYGQQQHQMDNPAAAASSSFLRDFIAADASEQLDATLVSMLWNAPAPPSIAPQQLDFTTDAAATPIPAQPPQASSTGSGRRRRGSAEHAQAQQQPAVQSSYTVPEMRGKDIVYNPDLHLWCSETFEIDCSAGYKLPLIILDIVAWVSANSMRIRLRNVPMEDIRTARYSPGDEWSKFPSDGTMGYIVPEKAFALFHANQRGKGITLFHSGNNKNPTIKLLHDRTDRPAYVRYSASFREPDIGFCMEHYYELFDCSTPGPKDTYIWIKMSSAPKKRKLRVLPVGGASPVAPPAPAAAPAPGPGAAKIRGGKRKLDATTQLLSSVLQGVDIEAAGGDSAVPSLHDIASSLPAQACEDLRQFFQPDMLNNSGVFGRVANAPDIVSHAAENTFATRVVNIYGQSGAGKSSMALLYESLYADKYSFIRTISGENIEHELRELKKSLRLSEMVHDNILKATLARFPGWLMIVDDLHQNDVLRLFSTISPTGGHVIVLSSQELDLSQLPQDMTASHSDTVSTDSGDVPVQTVAGFVVAQHEITSSNADMLHRLSGIERDHEGALALASCPTCASHSHALTLSQAAIVISKNYQHLPLPFHAYHNDLHLTGATVSAAPKRVATDSHNVETGLSSSSTCSTAGHDTLDSAAANGMVLEAKKRCQSLGHCRASAEEAL